MSDIALVTGASGFVGSAVARALVARGLRVRVLLRPNASRLNIAGVDCEPVTGDMRGMTSLGEGFLQIISSLPIVFYDENLHGAVIRDFAGRLSSRHLHFSLCQSASRSR